MLKKILVIAAVGLLCLAGGGWNRLNACPRATTVEYYGYMYDGCGDFATCYPIILGAPPYAYYALVGEEIEDCDGNYTSWGLTDCPDTAFTHTQCECMP